MKKMLLLTMAMVLVGLLLGSVALAQQTTVIQGTTMIIFNDPKAVAPMTALTTGPLAPSGGPSILLPAAALLVGNRRADVRYSQTRRVKQATPAQLRWLGA